MRPVNLLPSTERPVKAAAQGNGSYVVLGVLGVLLILVFGLVVSQNRINSATEDIAQAEQEKAEAEARAGQLGAFGEFSAIKETRLASVTGLAEARFDWERLMRELALVLPDKTFVTEATASVAAASDDPTAAAVPDPAASGPSLELTGCAPSQTVVAEAMVRLRSLYRAADVQLGESAAPDEATGTTAGTSSGSAEGCGPDYEFSATVLFAPESAAGAEAPEGGVPTALGGGS